MKQSNSRLNESVEQPSQSHPRTNLVTCRHCGRRGLPERIAAHECPTQTPLGRLTILEHPSSTRQTPQSLPVDQLTIEWTPTDGPTQTLTFEPTATGFDRIESTKIATTWHTGGTELLPLTLTLTHSQSQSTTQEAHHE